MSLLYKHKSLAWVLDPGLTIITKTHGSQLTNGAVCTLENVVSGITSCVMKQKLGSISIMDMHLVMSKIAPVIAGLKGVLGMIPTCHAVTDNKFAQDEIARATPESNTWQQQQQQ
jgi:hypothetical protein